MNTFVSSWVFFLRMHFCFTNTISCAIISTGKKFIHQVLLLFRRFSASSDLRDCLYVMFPCTAGRCYCPRWVGWGEPSPALVFRVYVHQCTRWLRRTTSVRCSSMQRRLCSKTWYLGSSKVSTASVRKPRTPYEICAAFREIGLKKWKSIVAYSTKEP